MLGSAQVRAVDRRTVSSASAHDAVSRSSRTHRIRHRRSRGSDEERGRGDSMNRAQVSEVRHLRFDELVLGLRECFVGRVREQGIDCLLDIGPSRRIGDAYRRDVEDVACRLRDRCIHVAIVQEDGRGRLAR
jgi:hypothetical protein